VGEKTEQPTARRLREARRDGKVPHSQELAGSVASLAVFGVVYGLAWFWWDDAMTRVRSVIQHWARAPDATGASEFMFVTGLAVTAFAALLCSIGGVLAILAGALQTGGAFSSKPLSPDPSKLNPISGLKRIFSLRTVAVAVAVALKLGVVYAVTDSTLEEARRSLGSYLLLTGPAMMAAIAKPVATLTSGVLVAAFGLGLADLLVQRYMHIEDMKMDQHEVKEDFKTTEGDPLVKSRRRSIGWSDIFDGPEGAVKRSTVIVTNPTHLCVGLRYDARDETPVPVVTLLAADDAAARVRQLAAREGIPTVEWVWLARRLHAEATVDAPIPDALFGPVADVLAWLVARADGSDRPWQSPTGPD
jgi:type III secretion protein U